MVRVTERAEEQKFNQLAMTLLSSFCCYEQLIGKIPG